MRDLSFPSSQASAADKPESMNIDSETQRNVRQRRVQPQTHPQQQPELVPQLVQQQQLQVQQQEQQQAALLQQQQLELQRHHQNMQPPQGQSEIMLLLQQMRQDNSNFQVNIASQITTQISAELAPIFAQVDRLTLQVEHGQTHAQFANGDDQTGVWVNPDDDEDSDMEDTPAGVEENGFAAVRGKKKAKRKGKERERAPA